MEDKKKNEIKKDVKKDAKKAEKKVIVLTYSKEQIVASKRYESYKDFLNGNLADNQMYSLEEVDALIDKNYKEG